MLQVSIEEVADFDEDGQIVGMQFDTRERAIQQWREKKEAEDFDRLCDRLVARNRARARRATQQGRIANRRASTKFYRRNRDKICAARRRARKAEYDADPVVHQCEWCGQHWSPEYDNCRGKSNVRFCSDRCRWQHRNSRRFKKSDRRAKIRQEILEFVTKHPGSTSIEIIESLAAKRHSTLKVLKRMVDSGQLSRTGTPRRFRYFAEQI